MPTSRLTKKQSPSHKKSPLQKGAVSGRARKKLLLWFEKNKRDLPWRQTKDPYKIWISEVMLQQTTAKTVIPFYRRFLKKFPDINSLARAKQKDIFPLWAGLGYYKRAELILKSARAIKARGAFPKSFKELQQLSGFGPYSSRALSSLAFEEPVGVLDGNVVRFLSRFHDLELKSWRPKDRLELQTVSDLWVKGQKPSRMNQALMEIGALICRWQKPACGICPLSRDCLARKKGKTQILPLKKPAKKVEFWRYRPLLIQKGARWAFIKNERLPFLKGRMIFPGQAEQTSGKGQDFAFSHCVTHYKIFVSPRRGSSPPNHPFEWLSHKEIQKHNPSSLIKKALACCNKQETLGF